jgi:ectoine hydroxylase-related dioxygenase (phytanoyl-CoA dioxygenase family)
MKDNFYGVVEQTHIQNDLARYVEEITIRGYAVIPSLFSPAELAEWRNKIDCVYQQQETEFSRDALMRIQDLDICRAPLLYDFEFMQLAAHPLVLSIIKQFLGEWFILNLQNAIINRPHQIHHQSAWHRDLPYQNWVCSRPLAISVLVAIDEFSEATGGTNLIPLTHKIAHMPSDDYIAANKIVMSVPAGSVIVFDAMLFHRGGANHSTHVRRAVNHMYTIPIMKQQYDFPRALGERPDLDGETARLLGYTSQVPLNNTVWRELRSQRITLTAE